MRSRSSLAALAACITLSTAVSLADGRAILTGKVTNSAAKPIEHATVMVYHAGVKTGYSTFCPSCYADCGKRAITVADGSFIIKGLSPDLRFQLLIVRDGYAPVFVKNVDPVEGPAPTATLTPRPTTADPARVVRGRVVNANGTVVRDAVVEPRGIKFHTEDGRTTGMFGEIPGLDPIAVTNEKGEFEIAYSQPAISMVLSIEARGMAPKVFMAAKTGADRQTMTVADGAMVHGRLVQNGKPVAGAEMGIYSTNHANGAGYHEVRIGTREDGSFAFTGVPTEETWYVYGKMESIARRGATQPIEIATKSDGQDIDLGDIEIKPGHRIGGRVTLSDGKPIPQGMRVFVAAGCMACGPEVAPGLRTYLPGPNDTQTAPLGPDGRFEFAGLSNGPYQVWAAVNGYGMAANKAQRNQLEMLNVIEAKVDRDIVNFDLALDPVR